MVDIIALTADVVSAHSGLLWQALIKIDQFCREYGSEDAGVSLAHEILSALKMEYPTTLVWVGVKDSLVVGHAVTSIQERGTKRWIEVAQYHRYDNSEASNKAIAEILKKVEGWGANVGATEVRLATLVEGHGGKVVSSRARLFESKFGFRPHRLVMKKEI